MNIRYALLFVLLFSFSFVRPMDNVQAGAQKCVQMAKNLTEYIPSMQTIKSTLVKAKNTVIATVKENPSISIAVGTGAMLLTGVYLYCKKCRSRKVCRQDRKQSVVHPSQQAQASAKPENVEYVETVNDSDIPLTIRVTVPAKSRAKTQIINCK